MASLGNLYFDILLKDKTKAERDRIKKELDDLKANVDIKFNRTQLINDLKATLRGHSIDADIKLKKFDVSSLVSSIKNELRGHDFKVNIVVDKASARQAVQQALAQAAPNWNGKYTADDLRAERGKTQQALAGMRQAQAELARVRAAHISARDAANSHLGAAIRMGSVLGTQVSVVGQLKEQFLSLYSVYALQGFIRNIIHIGGELEKQRIALNSIIGDAGQAGQLMSQLNALAVKSPFGVMDMNSYAKQLSAYGVQYNEIYETTKRLADISAGVGVDMGRIILAYGQVKAATVLKGTELRQFTEAGIPMVEALADRFTKLEGTMVSAADVFDRISKKQVSFDDVKAVLWDLTDEGGKFYNMQELLSESLSAKWKNLADSIDLMFGEMANSTGGPLKWVAEGLTTLIQHWKEVAAVISGVVTGLGIYKVSMWGATTSSTKLANATWATIQAKMQENRQNAMLAQAYRALSAEEQLYVGKKNAAKIAAIQNAAATGMLTKEQLLYLVATKKVTVHQALAVAGTLNLTRAEINQAAATKRLTILKLKLQMAIGSVFRSLKALIFNPYTAITAGLSVAIELFMKAKQKQEELTNAISEMRDVANEGFKNLGEAAQKYPVGGSEGLTNDQMQQSINEMEVKLKDYNPAWKEIFHDAYEADEEGHVKSLAEQYEFLAQKLEQTRDAYQVLPEIGAAVLNANDNTDAGLFDESFTESIKSYVEKTAEVRKKLIDVGNNRTIIFKAVAEVSKNDAELTEALKGKNQEEQIKYLAENAESYSKVYQQLDQFQNNVLGFDKDQYGEAKNALRQYMNAHYDALTQYEQEVLPKAEAYAESLKNYLALRGYDPENLPPEIQDSVRKALSDMISTIEGMTPDVRKKIEAMLLPKFNIKVGVEIEDGKKKLLAWQQDMIGQVENKQIIQIIEAAPDYLSAIQAIDKLRAESQAKIDAMAPIGIPLGITVSSKRLEKVTVGALATPEAMAFAEDWNRLVDLINATLDAQKKWGGYGSSNSRSSHGGNRNHKKSNTDKSDKELEQKKKELEHLKDAREKYLKLLEQYGEDMIAQKVQEDEDLKKYFSKGITFDDAGYRKALKNAKIEVKGDAKMKGGRTDFNEGIDEMIFDLDMDAIKDKSERARKEIEQFIKTRQKLWDLYKKIFEHTGDKVKAANVAFNSDNLPFDNLIEDLRAKLNEKLSVKGLKLEDIPFTMDLEDVEDKLGKENGDIIELWKALKEKLENEGVDIRIEAAQAIKEIQGISDKIKSIEAQRDMKVSELRSVGAPEDEINAITEKYNREIYKLRGELFKISPAFENLFKDTTDMSTRQIDKMRGEVQSLLDLIDKGRNENGGTFFDSNKKETFYKFTDENGVEQIISKKDYDQIVKRMEKLGKKSSKLQKSFGRLWDWINGKEQKNGGKLTFEEIAEDLSTVIKEAKAATDSLGSLFEVLGMDGVAEGLQTASEILGGMEEITTGFASGNPFAIVQGLAGILTSIFSLHDKALQKKIEQSQRRVTELQNVYGAIDRMLEHHLGHGADMMFAPAEDDLKRLDELQDKIVGLQGKMGKDGTYADWYYLAELEKLNKEQEKLQARKDAYQTGGAYGYQRRLLEEQLAELEKQKEAQEKMKNKDQGAIDDTKAQISEVQDQIRWFAEDTANTLYGIDLKQWASELGDALFEAWQKGEDGAEAFKNKVGDIMGSVMNNVLKLGILEPAMEKIRLALFGEDGKSGMLGDDSKLDETEMQSLAGMLMDVGKDADAYTAALEELEKYLKDNYGISMKGDEGGEGLSKGIQGVTEDTANLLASYINAIRSDTAMQREYGRQLMEDVLPSMTVMAQAQLQQLQAIERNTARIADSNDEINETLSRNVVAGQGFKIA